MFKDISVSVKAAANQRAVVGVQRELCTVKYNRVILTVNLFQRQLCTPDTHIRHADFTVLD